MNKRQKQSLLTSIEVCDAIVNSIVKRNNGQLNCKSYCPGEEILISTITQLIEVFRDIEPLICNRLDLELSKVKMQSNQCVNPFSFGAIVAIVGILGNKYLFNEESHKKFFISHSSQDEKIVKSFIKEILKIGCGFKDSEIFCTLDSSAIKTGDDFREKIVENMQSSDFILLFISHSFNESEVCKNELGAAWAMKNKRVLPFVLPGTSFEQMGFLNIVKQSAIVTDKVKLDEFYNEVCEYFSIPTDWPAFNKAKEDFVEAVI